jgi:hypothetical protein
MNRRTIQLAMCVAFVLSPWLMTLAPAQAQSGDPSTRITLPSADQTVRGTVTIQGTATSPVFSRYELAYAQEPDLATWVPLGGSVQPIQNGTLGVWNTRPLADGAYALRLQVFGSDGAINETLVRNITLANAAAPVAAPASAVTETVEGPAVVAEVQTARNTLQVIGATLAEAPDAFARGARIALLAFVALGAYLVIKKLVLFTLRRATQKPVDYGK